MNIRESIPEDNAEDKSALLPAFLEIWNASENLKYLSFTQKPFDKDIVSAWLDNHKEQGGRYFCIVSKNAEILGIMITKENPIDGFEIYGIGVNPAFKHQDIGRKLIEHAINTAIDLKYKAIDSLVFADNVPMLRLLLSLSFIPVSMDYHKRSDCADTILLRKYM